MSKCFYISGFDPRGVRHYARLFRDEYPSINSQKETNVKKYKKKSKDIFEIDLPKDGTKNSELYFLNWQRIIIQNWSKSIVNFIISLLLFYSQLFHKRKALTKICSNHLFFLAVFLPAITGIFLSVSILGLLYTVAKGDYILTVISLFAFIAVLATATKYKIGWLSRIFCFYNKFDSKSEDTKNCVKNWAEVILSDLKHDNKKIIIIAHSVGAIFVPLLIYEIAKNLKIEQSQLLLNRLQIITLGQSIPLFLHIQISAEYIHKLQYVNQLELDWLEVTSPADILSSGQLPIFDAADKNYTNFSKIKFNIVNPQFYKHLPREVYSQFKKDKFLFHFIYLKNLDKLYKENNSNLFNLYKFFKSCES